MPPAPPAPPTVIEVYTPFFVGTFLNIFLYGIAVTQMYTYYRTSRADKRWMKFLVSYLFVLETVNTFCDIGLLFQPLLLNFGNQDIIVTSPWTLRLDGITTALISTPVQIFMAWRIKIIMGTVFPTVFVVLLALSSLTGSVWLAIAVSNSPQFEKFSEFRAAPGLWLISSAVADITIACCLVYGLSRKRTGFAVLNDQIDRIIRVTVQTGSLTALTALIDVIVFLTVPNTTIFFAWDLMLSKLYTTTLLSSLNARVSAQQVQRQKHAEPNALFTGETSSGAVSHQHLTFTTPSTLSRYNPQQAPKISGEYSSQPGTFELTSQPPSRAMSPASRALSPPRRERGHGMPVASTEFNVLASQSTETDDSLYRGRDMPLYPPKKLGSF